MTTRASAAFFALLVTGAATAASAQSASPARSWFVQAGATGDGSSVASPTGSLATIERLSAPGDRIVLLAAEALLDGGIALKPGQRLIGVDGADGRKARLTNTDSTRHFGSGVLLASGSSVANLRIEAPLASGIYGLDATDVRIDSVDVSDANRAQAFIDALFPTLPGRVPHGGMVFVHTRAGEVAVTASTVTATAGLGIASHASAAARTRLTIRHTRVEGGSRIGFYDIGIAALVRDAGTTTRLEIFDSRVYGRMSRSGRNVMATASGGALADAHIERSYSGATGQDGVVIAARQSPSEVRLRISDSVLEDAGQMNVEGTLINLPPEAGAPAGAARVSIEIERSTIRRAGAVPGHEDVASNIWLGGTQFVPDAPPAVGHYTLRLTDSHVDSARRAGLEFGSKRITAAGMTEPNIFDVVLRGNTIGHNGETDVKLHARGARIDARGNCWRTSAGSAAPRVMAMDPADRAQFDASAPMPCPAR